MGERGCVTSVVIETGKHTPDGGCAGCGCILTFGLAAAVFGASLFYSCTARIPGTESNISFAGSVGSRDIGERALPGYITRHFESADDFYRYLQKVDLGFIEGNTRGYLGVDSEVPAFDIQIGIKK